MSKKLIIKNNLIDSFKNKDIDVVDKSIIFKKNGDYIIEYIDCDNVSYDYSVLDGVSVNLFIYSRDNCICVNNHYELKNDSCLTLFQFYDNKSVNEDSIIDLNGVNSKFYQGFSSVSRGDEEYHIVVHHNQKCCYSDIRNKCVGLDGSKIYMRIDSYLEKGNVDCVMEQSSRILTLGDVEAKIIPNMFIDEDSVEARHGSIIGGFSFDDVFYLMSRGISYDEAILLLVKGYLFSNMKLDYEKREYIMNSILNLRG